MFSRTSRAAAVLQALLVTFLWSTSWVLIKAGLEDVAPLTFAGLRYALAFLCLLPVALWHARSRAELRSLSRRDVGRLALLGALMYALTQGAQFVGLALLPAVSVSLLLNFTPVVVILLAVPLLGERPARLQPLGVALFLTGAVVYFAPLGSLAGQVFGLAVVALGVFANAAAAVLGRSVNRGSFGPLVVTVVSMGVGSALLLGTGLVVEGAPEIGVSGWAIIAWLAVVNTAFAFTLWNHTLRTLTALESNVINNTMLIQVAVLAWIFLGEKISLQAGVGVIVAALGVLLVQVAPNLESRRTGREP